jgi:DNA-binding SARP family transcriptional activator
MTRLELTLFGSPLISIDGIPINSRIDKGIALVALLALQGPTLHRDALIAYLWTGSESSKARAALRTAIWRLKESRLSPWLGIEREYITLHKDADIWIDVEEFQTNLEKSKQPPHDLTTSCQICSILLERAANLYHGDFMAGYSPRNAAGFDEWRSQFGQLLRNDYLIALERLVKGFHEHGQYANAVQMARYWLAIDTYNEEAHSMIIRSYANNDQRANAIAHFRNYKRLVENKLGISPSKEITALYERLLAGKKPPLVSTGPLKDPALLLLDIPHIPDLWAKYGILIEKVVAKFTNLVKDSLQQFGGQLIKHTGDSFTIYFDQGQPLLCAIALQHLVAKTRWGLPDHLLIRMVVTTISNTQSSYPEYSPDLLSCRQLLQSASGNQILITEQAARTLEFPTSSRPQYLGSFLLSGQINWFTHIYQLRNPMGSKTWSDLQPLCQYSLPDLSGVKLNSTR